MPPILLAQPEQRWSCPNCNAQAVTHLPPDAVASQMHTCRGLKGLTAPMVPAGTKAKVEANRPQDYIGREIVTRDGDGQPVMNVETTRDDGNDIAVFAPLATLRGD
jgi:hypothetical protein